MFQLYNSERENILMEDFCRKSSGKVFIWKTKMVGNSAAIVPQIGDMFISPYNVERLN
jgi:hypothetical protein